MKADIFSAVSLGYCFIASASGGLSTDYAARPEILDGGGGPASSTDYLGAGSIGMITGTSSSADYGLDAGFLPQAATVGVAFGGHAFGTTSVRTFTFINTGDVTIYGLSFNTGGADVSNFSVLSPDVGKTVAPGGSAVFTVIFVPAGFSSGSRAAVLHVSGGNIGGVYFDVELTGHAFSTTADADGDWLNDWAEYRFTSLGFHWEVAQPTLVNALNTGASAANLYTPGQVQALNVGVPLIQRNPSTGVFTLTIGVEKSADLSTFNPFPMTAPQTSINGQGKLEFQFTSPENTEFFRLETK